jgi:hypothetical protein
MLTQQWHTTGRKALKHTHLCRDGVSFRSIAAEVHVFRRHSILLAFAAVLLDVVPAVAFALTC